MNRLLLLILMIMVVITAGCGTKEASPPAAAKQVEINVSAALGLKEALIDIQKEYEAKHPNIKIVYNLAAAGALEAQIKQGAPADIFISAAEKQLNDLEKENLVKQGTRKNIVGNQLVLVVPKNSNLNLTSFKDLAQDNVQKIGLGVPETVPAGQYGMEVLKYLGVWEKVQDKVVLGKDVRTLLAYAETGNTEASIVFSTVAATSDKVKIAAAAPEGSHQPIIFPGAVLAGTKQPKEAEEFLNYLVSTEGMKVFEKYGFIPLEQ